MSTSFGENGVPSMKTLKIGIASYARMKARTMAIARGEHSPTKDEPTVWFTSVESLANALSARNRELLTLIAEGEDLGQPGRPKMERKR